MKRIVMAFVIMVWATMSGFAQTHYQSNISVGVKAGASVSRVFFNPSVSQGWPFSPTAGVMVRYIEENHFGLIAEVNYVRRGWCENFNGAPFEYRRDIDYIEIPLLAHIYFGRRGRFFFNAGPEVAFRIGEHEKSNFNTGDIASIHGFPVANRRNAQLTEPVRQKVDFGIAAGIGGEFNINRRNSLSLEARYYFGIGNLMSAGRQDPFRASNQMTVALMLGYWFRIK